MKDSVKIILWTTLGISVTIGLFYLYRSLIKVETKEQAINILIDNNPTRYLDLLTSFDEGFLKAWATATLRHEKTFTYNGEKYDSWTGKHLGKSV